ncbi:DUF726 domain-containing protein [Mycolicibacter acidiphilus]|nr:DUF726 domain-containing protein [Mycolicibacter acidiphilus]
MEPTTDGDPRMIRNHALLNNLWAFGKHMKQHLILRNQEKRDSHAKQAQEHEKLAVAIAKLIDLEGTDTRAAWCSACLSHADHLELTMPIASVPAYLCSACGSPTLGCAAPRCEHMATRGFGALRIPRYCAEHRHEVPSFDKVNGKVGPLENYANFLVYDKKNLALGSRVAGAVTAAGAVIGTGGLMLAPAIGGAVGTLVGGYTGAAATSYGLALLGGGSLAAGGMGTAGGTAVVAGLGTLLGGGLGARVTTAYIGADKSFRIDKLADGSGSPVIVASGFLTDGGGSWGDWEPIIRQRYPEAPVYRVHWGSKELAELGAMLGYGGGKAAAAVAVKGLAARASKAGAKLIPGAGTAFVAAGLAMNPWHTAKVRADSTGVALAGLLARTDAEDYVLVGHSLGARVMATAAQAVATDPAAPKIRTVHLLGAALGANGDWRTLNDSVIDAVYNYYSTNDKVLKYLYAAVQAGSKAAGLRGFGTGFPKIKDRNVSRMASGHSEYLNHVKLV